MTTWLKISSNSYFSIYNLPFGIISAHKKKPQGGVRIGDYVIDLQQTRKLGLLNIPRNICNQSSLNRLIGLGKKRTNAVRIQFQEWLIQEKSLIKRHFEHLFLKIENVKKIYH
jgi:fumarylacetoacetase